MNKSRIIFVLLFLTSFSAGAQFLYSLGAAIGVSYGKEVWSHEEWATQEKYLFGLNGAILAEFFQDTHFQWRSEFMYNQLGTGEAVNGTNYTNRTNYLTFNNYLKVNLPLYGCIPYILIGPRVEYLLSRSAAVFPDAIGGMYSLHLTGAVGIGVEKICFSRIKPFIELFYNRDIMPSFKGNVLSNSPEPPLQGTALSEIINNHDYELRIGLKYVFKSKGKCPAVDNAADGHYPNNP